VENIRKEVCMSSIKQYSEREALTIMRKNGYEVVRYSGDHRIFKNKIGNTISVPVGEPNKMMMRRLIKENRLEV
jgi:predicted RNA binding protein YcfA (HicA-like mRNA interferase family)